MPKMKSNRGAAKRFRTTASGLIKRSKANKSHILTKKKQKRKRNLRQGTLISEGDYKRMKKLIIPSL